MNIDWEAIIGPDEPVIVAPWEGFADLRLHPEAAHALPETSGSPELAEALLALNAPASPLFTSKCDLWPLEPGEIDPDEFDAVPSGAQHGLAAYIDILCAEPARRTAFPAIEQLARAIVRTLRGEDAGEPGRIDLVLRPADVDGEPGYAFTLYVSACGATAESARRHFRAVLHAAVLATMGAVRQQPEMGE